MSDRLTAARDALKALHDFLWDEMEWFSDESAPMPRYTTMAHGQKHDDLVERFHDAYPELLAAAEAPGRVAALEAALETLADQWEREAEGSGWMEQQPWRIRRQHASALRAALAAPASPAGVSEFRALVNEARANHVRWEHEAEVLEECIRPMCLGAKVLLWPDIEDPRTSALAAAEAPGRAVDEAREALTFIAEWANDCADDQPAAAFYGFADIRDRARAALVAHLRRTDHE